MNSDEEYGSIFRALSGTSGIGPTGAGRGASKWGGGRYLALQHQIAPGPIAELPRLEASCFL